MAAAIIATYARRRSALERIRRWQTKGSADRLECHLAQLVLAEFVPWDIIALSRLTDLIAHLRIKDPQMGADLENEFKALSSRLAFGLNFERHRPEAVELPQRLVRRGDKVRVLPERGSTKKGDRRLWLVKRVHKLGTPTAELELIGTDVQEFRIVPLGDLVVVAEFRDTIFPGLVGTGRIAREAGKPFHTVINGENYHVLKALTYTHRGKVDAIYIDPPYNGGARDWKYNNDFVEKDDQYRPTGKIRRKIGLSTGHAT